MFDQNHKTFPLENKDLIKTKLLFEINFTVSFDSYKNNVF